MPSIYYDPNEDGTATTKKEFVPLPDAEYFCHITSYNDPTKSLTTKKGAVCDIMKLELTVNADKHPEWADRKIWSDVWITLSVKGKEPTSGDNLSFGKFLDSINYPLEQTEVEINGVKKSVSVLPFGVDEIDQDHIVGRPVKVTTYTDHWTGRDGQARTSNKVRYYNQWNGGQLLEEDDDLPF